jgi:chromosome partitioning protein
MKMVAFFNNQSGVGKTTLIYHLAWIFQEIGVSVVAVDLDPQSALTATFLPEETIAHLWRDRASPHTILGIIQPLLDRSGDLRPPILADIGSHLALLPGHPSLGCFEDRFAEAWLQCLAGNPEEAQDGLLLTTCFNHAAERAATARKADLVLIDTGPSFDALNRAALVACDFVVFPLGTDFYTVQGLSDLSSVLAAWRSGWAARSAVASNLPLPAGAMRPAGYVVLQHAVRVDRPVKASQHSVERIPAAYHEMILGEPQGVPLPGPDPYRLATIKQSPGLMPLARDSHKPMFLLKPADGIAGAQGEAVLACYRDFKGLAARIASACGIAVP